MKGKFVTIIPVMTIDGTLDLSDHTTNCDSVIKAIDVPDNGEVTIAFVADSARSGGQIDESAFPDIVYHFDPGVSTVADFEALVAESAYLEVATPGTGANILEVSVDEFAAFQLSSGVLDTATDQCQADTTGLINVSVFLNQLTDAGTVTLLVESTIDGSNWATITSKDASDFPAGDNKSIEITLSDANGMPTVQKGIRVTATALATGGVYSAAIAGTLVDGYR